MKLGNKIAVRRKELGLTQQELADKLYVSVKTISKWETNRGNPEINILPRIAEALNIEISELFDDNINYQEHRPPKRKIDFIYICFEFGFVILGLIFYAVTFIAVEGSMNFGDSFFGDFFEGQVVKYTFSGYRILFSMSGNNFLGSLLVLSIWISFFAILSHIAMGMIEIFVTKEDVIEVRNKVSYIIAIVGMLSIGIALIITIISSISIGMGMILTSLLFVFILGYNIKIKNR